MKRRDLNPGDVFVYVNYPVTTWAAGPAYGTIRCVGAPEDSWVPSAEPSYTDSLSSEVLDAPVVRIKPTHAHQTIQTELDSLKAALSDLADTYL